MRRGLIGQLRGKQAELSLSQSRLERYRNTTVPLAKAQTEAALTAYRAGAGTLTAVADASRKALNISLERLKLEAATARLWADLAFLMPLPTAAQPTSLQGAQP
ncbi:TolC family protein [Cupriavidus necator]|uniref:TolC family protein n=1 Tax=Cupriavidus necator TaxID=106590 RepID=UPI003F739303